MARTKNIAEYIRAKMATDHELAASVEEEVINAHIAQQVYDLRKEAGLSQKELAEQIGTQQSVISRIEDSDYEGHSLDLLKRIASVLGKKLRVEFYDEPIISASTYTEVKVTARPLSEEFPLHASTPGYLTTAGNAYCPAIPV